MQWLRGRLGDRLTEAAADVVIDNGSGLSRENRVSADLLAQVLTLAYDSPVMSELMSSLPISGVDGTLRRSRATPGRAHLKTGSLRDVTGVAGYVLSNSGRRYVLVAIVNHPQAGAARPALDALVQWTLRDAPR
jgi:D-alanyl-D-alanine carboxypeptidase/D-alanyl-D-alanine-endopeptidase (penicillin-binding protein 4)